jgi:hypothetical protein
VARREVSVIAVAQGASELSICFAVPAENAAEVVRCIHDEFCSQTEANIPVCLRPTMTASQEA